MNQRNLQNQRDNFKDVENQKFIRWFVERMEQKRRQTNSYRDLNFLKMKIKLNIPY